MTRIAAAMVLMAVAGTAVPAAARELQEVRNTGTLRVGVTLYAPWAMRGSDGELVGFEIDVARKIAEDLAVRLEHVRARALHALGRDAEAATAYDNG